MLNGKFFTGLPPKMIDRGGAAATRNRLESHFFWPDDTKVDTAVECRIKRRNSVLEKSDERPRREQQISVADNEVDTKKRFSKEFSQSSIQFYDNLNDDRTKSGRHNLRNLKAYKKMEIADKPTNTKLELPESIVDENYTNAKKKQAYTSKIEFYDYKNDEREEPQNNRNNLRKPRMDMNDKREVELNSKNSPKLQVKRDVRSYSEEKEQRKVNNREIRTNERPIRNNYVKRDRDEVLSDEKRYLQSRHSVEPRLNKSPQRNAVKPKNHFRERYSMERETLIEPSHINNYGRRNPANYEYLEDNLNYERDNRYIKPENRAPYEPRDDNNYYDYDKVEQEVQNRMRSIQLKSPPPRIQYYQPEEYYDDEPDNYYDDDDQFRAPTKRGSTQRGYNHSKVNYNEVDLPNENVNTPQSLMKNSTIKRINNRLEKQVATPENDLQSASKPQKHLRSSLRFNDGAIVADNNNDDTQAPTSPQYPTQRRYARTSATQRVSVGLPD